MRRLRVDRSAVTSSNARLTVTSIIGPFAAASKMNCFAVASHNGCIPITKNILALLVSFSLLTTPVWAVPSSSLGTVVYADRARVGAAQASVGTTVFSGDRLSTEQARSVQVRAGAALLLLSSANIATFSQDDATPSATLTLGSAIFSTANSKAFALHGASAVIRPSANQPTIGQVTVLNPNALIVQRTRGSLTITVADDERALPERAPY